MWRVNLPSCVKSIPSSCLTPRIVFPSCHRPNFQLSVFKKDEGGVEQPTKVKVTCEDTGHCWFKLHQIADQYSRPLMDFTDARLMFLPVLGFFFNRLGV